VQDAVGEILFLQDGADVLVDRAEAVLIFLLHVEKAVAVLFRRQDGGHCEALDLLGGQLARLEDQQLGVLDDQFPDGFQRPLLVVGRQDPELPVVDLGRAVGGAGFARAVRLGETFGERVAPVLGVGLVGQLLEQRLAAELEGRHVELLVPIGPAGDAAARGAPPDDGERLAGDRLGVVLPGQVHAGQHLDRLLVDQALDFLVQVGVLFEHLVDDVVEGRVVDGDQLELQALLLLDLAQALGRLLLEEEQDLGDIVGGDGLVLVVGQQERVDHVLDGGAALLGDAQQEDGLEHQAGEQPLAHGQVGDGVLLDGLERLQRDLQLGHLLELVVQQVEHQVDGGQGRAAVSQDLVGRGVDEGEQGEVLDVAMQVEADLEHHRVDRVEVQEELLVVAEVRHGLRQVVVDLQQLPPLLVGLDDDVAVGQIQDIALGDVLDDERARQLVLDDFLVDVLVAGVERGRVEQVVEERRHHEHRVHAGGQGDGQHEFQIAGDPGHVAVGEELFGDVVQENQHLLALGDEVADEPDLFVGVLQLQPVLHGRQLVVARFPVTLGEGPVEQLLEGFLLTGLAVDLDDEVLSVQPGDGLLDCGTLDQAPRVRVLQHFPDHRQRVGFAHAAVAGQDERSALRARLLGQFLEQRGEVVGGFVGEDVRLDDVFLRQALERVNPVVRLQGDEVTDLLSLDGIDRGLVHKTQLYQLNALKGKFLGARCRRRTSSSRGSGSRPGPGAPRRDRPCPPSIRGEAPGPGGRRGTCRRPG